AVQDLKGLGYEKGKPVGLVGVTELSEAQKKQLKEQQEMQQMYDMIMKHKRAMQEMQLLWERALQQHQHGYDSDEEVDSELGTWEHRLRRMEMDKTRGAWGFQREFHPWGAAGWVGLGIPWIPGRAERRVGGLGIPDGNSIPRENRLRRMEMDKTRGAWGFQREFHPWGAPGWVGLGIPILGSSRVGGIGNSILGSSGGVPSHSRISCRGTTTMDGAGFGIERPAELTKEDDEYEAFRKRMMLAYPFRPNPLNNPRRPYY
ncbi:SUGP1 protein, partial [Vidua chalybeata]|nr:SUGP1 protein [Vidua chalybeata]